MRIEKLQCLVERQTQRIQNSAAEYRISDFFSLCVLEVGENKAAVKEFGSFGSQTRVQSANPKNSMATWHGEQKSSEIFCAKGVDRLTVVRTAELVPGKQLNGTCRS